MIRTVEHPHLPLQKEIRQALLSVEHIHLETCLFFDIETTGFSPRTAMIQQICLLHFSNPEEPELLHYFCNEVDDERPVLEAFFAQIHANTTLIHYNGNTFDLPFLKKRAQYHRLPLPASLNNGLDLYHTLRKLKPFLALPDFKLKTLEQQFGYQRLDSLSGKDVVSQYEAFMMEKLSKGTENQERLALLSAHNMEDVLATWQIASALTYRICPDDLNVTEHSQKKALQGKAKGAYPFPLTISQEFATISYDTTSVELQIPVFEGKLYHFYPDYENYYYLPEEDYAIHKSVGSFVDASHRKKATAKTCYTPAQGTFLPIPKKTFQDTPFTGTGKPMTFFQKENRSPLYYLPISSLNETDFFLYRTAIWNAVWDHI